ncbi:MAG: hypothetical protein H3C28_01870 [Sphingomonadales bacterium]|nr:hypothetical protein [Sphingomonadales bacterium]
MTYLEKIPLIVDQKIIYSPCLNYLLGLTKVDGSAPQIAADSEDGAGAGGTAMANAAQAVCEFYLS